MPGREGARDGRVVPRLGPYLPRLVVDWASSDLTDADRGAHLPPRWQVIDGSCIFADISGFTKMSERLARHGRIGAEEVADAIGTCFEALLAVAYDAGGSLLKFGGDALLLLFEGDDHAARAALTAAGMRARLRDVGRITTTAGTVTLRISLGAHSGELACFLVGGSHRELVVAGPGWTSVVEMEHEASAGEVLVSPEMAAQLDPALLAAPRGPGRLLRRQVHARPPRADATPSFAPDDVLARFVPTAIRDHVLAGGVDPEHRNATIGFVHFDGTDTIAREQGVEVVAGVLDALVRVAQDAADEHGITFIGTDVDGDGGKILLAAGAPRATGDHEERMLAAARRIVAADIACGVRAGVHRGPVFAGDVGPEYRRTYTTMGDTVNLAARLMARAAPGQVLATPDVLDRTRSSFATDELEPFTVKGKRKPVRAFVVGAPHSRDPIATEDPLPLVGREREVAALDAAIASVRAGDARVVELVGEAGIGKSRLVAELRRRAELPVIALACETYETATPYAPFWRLLHELLGVADTETPEVVAERLRATIVEACPHLLPMLPLLGDLLDLDLPDTPETRGIAPEFRPERLAVVTADLLHHLLPEPVLVTVEDAHWMDQASADLLERIVDVLVFRAALVCVTSRTHERGFHGQHVETLHLEPLDLADAAAAIELATADAPMTPDDMDAIVARAGGNPLFLGELLRVTRVAGVDALPDSVDSLLSARIDALPPDHRKVLRYAAVLGSGFERRELEAILADDLAGAPPLEQLGEFLEAETAERLRFRHALVHEAAYQTLPFRTRRVLHARAGDAIAGALGDHPEVEAELLSFHYFAAQRFEPAWRFAHLAGLRAEERYANVEAVQLLERAVTAAKRLAEPPAELPEAWEVLGDTRERSGRYAKAKDAYRAARALVADDPAALAKLMLKEAWVAERIGSASDAVRWVRRGQRLLDGVAGRPAAQVRAALSAWLATMRQTQGRSREAVRWCEQAIAEATASGNLDAEAQARFILDWAHVELGQPEQAVHSARALEIFEQLGRLDGQAGVLNNLGGFAYYEGRWDDAVALYERAHEKRVESGNAVEAAMTAYNIGEVLAQQGDLAEAARRFRRVLRTSQAAGYRSGVAIATMQLGRIAAREGRFDEAFELLDAACEELRTIGADAELVEVEVARAECLLLRGDETAARASAESTLVRASEAGPVAVAALHRVRGRALMDEGDLVEARHAFDASLETASCAHADYEVARTSEALAELATLEGDLPAAAAHAATAEAIFTRLQIRTTPAANELDAALSA